MSHADPVIRVHRLTKLFGQFAAVEDVSLEVGRGEIFGLIGPNGAGKSTLIKMLTTLLPPGAGTAEIAGFDIRKHPRDVRRSIGYVPQLLSADGNLTGYENLLLSARLYGIPRRFVPLAGGFRRPCSRIRHSPLHRLSAVCTDGRLKRQISPKVSALPGRLNGHE